MTITSNTRRVQYTANGSQQTFTYGYEIFTDADLNVYVGTALKVLTTDYTVSGAGTDSGGSITFLSAPANTTIVTILSNITVERTTAFASGGVFRAEDINDEFDKLVAMANELDVGLGRTVRMPVTDGDKTVELPVSASRASKFLSFDSSGNLEASTNVGEWKGNWATTTAYYKNDIVKDSTNDNIYIAITDYTSDSSVSADISAANLELVIDATAPTASASAAASSATAAATSATAAATSATSAATSATTATTQASTATTKASEAATSALNAVTSENNAATSATTSSAQATIATTKASEASTSASSASTSATNAATSASSASTSATNASASETFVEEWAIKTNGSLEASDSTQDYSSKAYAIGGTGVTNTAGKGASKEWAIKAEDSTVDGTNYSSLHHSAKATTSASNAATSATTATTQASTATTKASEASTSATNAATSATSSATSATSSATSATAAAASATAAAASAGTIDGTAISDGDADTTVETARTSQNDKIFLRTNGVDALTITESGGTATSTFSGDVAIQSRNDLKFYDADSSNYVALKSGATVASNVTWSLPTADGSASQVLETDGSSNLGWVTVTGGLGFAASNITTAPGSGTNYDLAESAAQDGDETPFVDTTDAFNIVTTDVYDCNEPVGSTTTVDYGSGESYVGA